MSNVQVGRELLASMNAARAEHAEEGRAIHERFLAGTQWSGEPSPPDPLIWSDDLAEGAIRYAERCARWRQLSHDDLEDGSSTYDRIHRRVPCDLAAENLASGDVSWLTPGRCHEQFMTADDPRLHSRENILNPAFTHVGAGFVEDEGVAYYVVSFARIDPTAATATEDRTTTPIWIVPLWEPEPVRWRIALKPDGADLRAQLAERFSIDGRRLIAVGVRDGDSLVLDRRPDALSGEPVIAIALSEFDPKFISLRPRADVTSATHAPAGTADTVPDTALDLLTRHELEALDTVRIARAAPTVAAADIDPAVLMPERRPGSPEETIFTQVAIDVRPENDAERLAAVRILDRAARHHEPLIGNPRFEYDLRQELTFGLQRDPLLRRDQLDALREAEQALSIDTAASPILFAIPYEGDDGHGAFISAAARRASLLKLQDPAVTLAFLDAHRAASKRRDARPETEALSLSTYRVLSFIAAAEWESEITYWTGVERAADGIFSDLPILPVVCEGDAKELVQRALDRQDDEEHPLHELAVLTRDALLRRLTRIADLAVAPLGARRRKDEPKILEELAGLIDDPTPLIESIPEARALLQEATWLTQSRLRTEIERMYRRYRAGDEGRNIIAFVRMLKLAAHHLGAAVDGASASEHIPLTHRMTDAASAGSSVRYREAVQPLRQRYLRGWLKRLARFCRPGGRSKLHLDLRPSVGALAMSVVERYWARRLRNAAATRAFALPLVAASALERCRRELLREVEEEVRSQRFRLEAFVHDPTAVILGADAHQAVDGAARAADLWWSRWLEAAHERKWMRMGAAVLSAAMGEEESPFGMSPGRIAERLFRAVGQERAAAASRPLPEADINDALTLMFQRASFTGVVDQHRLIELTTRHYPQQPSTIPLRTTWIVIIGRPLISSPESVNHLRDVLAAKKGTDYENLICTGSPAVSGIHFIAECHGFPLSALAL
jgi:hypothetical protein